MNRAFFTIVSPSAGVIVTNHPDRVQTVLVVVEPNPVESYEHAIAIPRQTGARLENVYVDPLPPHQVFADYLVVSDSIAVSVGVNKSDSVSPGDLLVSIDLILAKSDDITLSDGISIDLAASKSDSVVAADSVAKHVDSAKSDAVTPGDAHSAFLGKAISDSFSVTESITIITDFNRAFMSVEVLAVDEVSIDIDLAKSDSITVADSGTIGLLDTASGLINGALVGSRRVSSLAGAQFLTF